jgi:hypothetical protein
MCSVTNRATFDGLLKLDVQKLSELDRNRNEFKLNLTKYQILVNVDAQRLHLVESEKLIRSYLISTALNGTGQEENTGKTPLGLHFIHSKIGDKAQPFEVFRSRISTGTIATADVGEKLIVGRILWLQGVQPGFNQGKDFAGKVVDTHQRYIYIHGTNDIAHIGSPFSEGCIRMKPDDVIELFEYVVEKTPVYIYQA